MKDIVFATFPSLGTIPDTHSLKEGRFILAHAFSPWVARSKGERMWQMKSYPSHNGEEAESGLGLRREMCHSR